jgi:hypothetical protein
MRPKEINLENMNFDYYFLRSNQVSVETTLRILEEAYRRPKK